jgi:hypothetical protein
MKICVQFVLYSLMDEQKEHRGTISEDFIHTCQTNPHFLSCNQIFQYDSKTKCQSMEW